MKEMAEKGREGISRREFLYVALIGTLAAACGKASQSSNAPETVGPMPTKIPPVVPTETSTPIPTETVTPTPEVIPAFIPEGFSEGPAGLLRNPETGQDTIVFNKEADWKKTRETILGGLWEINVDWSKWTGQASDATRYKTKEDFIKAALEGQKFHLGIPVRVNGNLLPRDWQAIQDAKAALMVLKMVDVKLNNLQIQVLAPEAFQAYSGKGWGTDGQEAYICSAGSITSFQTGAGACLFSAENEEFTISVGSFYQGDMVPDSKRFIIGDFFNLKSHKKYPTYYRPDGLGVMADYAAAYTLSSGFSEFDDIVSTHYNFMGVSGSNIKVFSISRAQGVSDDSAYLNPPLFKFSQ